MLNWIIDNLPSNNFFIFGGIALLAYALIALKIADYVIERTLKNFKEL